MVKGDLPSHFDPRDSALEKDPFTGGERGNENGLHFGFGFVRAGTDGRPGARGMGPSPGAPACLE
jgi:hypothetical protein